ncbi:hypothetical protein J5N97_003051 [Dioscorea zingiberensis]|uniref:protein disulfide-isomerase n=1 Tax=Dioscorea zingiberensis TaxID=325984 RepID=A0A9D5D3D9_9LILI|nr:hypothetical protein J5N97_003051 [Dioscorea zingiberensis]
MARGEEGNEFVEKDEILEDLGEYSGDFTGATVPEGLDPGVPEVEDMALPYGKQMSSFGCDFSMPLSRWQVGVFPEFSGKEYENFMDVAEKLLSDYDFGHTSDAKLLPHGDSAVKHPKVRLFKPFDELLVDTQDFQVDALERFIEVSDCTVVTLFNKDPSNHPYVIKFFNNPNDKA